MGAKSNQFLSLVKISRVCLENVVKGCSYYLTIIIHRRFIEYFLLVECFHFNIGLYCYLLSVIKNINNDVI